MHEAWYIVTITLLSSSTANHPKVPSVTGQSEMPSEQEGPMSASQQLAAANLGPDQAPESPDDDDVDNDRGPFDDLLEPQQKTSRLAEAVAYNIDYAVICMSR